MGATRSISHLVFPILTIKPTRKFWDDESSVRTKWTFDSTDSFTSNWAWAAASILKEGWDKLVLPASWLPRLLLLDLQFGKSKEKEFCMRSYRVESKGSKFHPWLQLDSLGVLYTRNEGWFSKYGYRRDLWRWPNVQRQKRLFACWDVALQRFLSKLCQQ